VHHGYYRSFDADPWDYEPETLWCLCWNCHQEYELKLRAIHRKIGSVHPRNYAQLASLLDAPIFTVNFGITPQEAEAILEEIKADEASQFSDYSVKLTANSDTGPSRAPELMVQAERVFPGITISIQESANDPDLNAYVEGPDVSVVSEIEGWFDSKRGHLM
jgi:hypothetical protein